MAGFGLNLKLVLYLQSQCLTESFDFLNPPLLQAAKRWRSVQNRTYADENNLILTLILNRMQKVITVTTHTNIIGKDEKFTEKEYPMLDKYLSEGYKVIETTPVTLNSTTAYMYSITFLLEK